MRAILTACAALAALSLASCDINTGTPNNAQAGCHCTAPPPAPVPPAAGTETAYAPPPPAHHRHHGGVYAYGGHGRYSGHGSYYWRREFSEVSVQTYEYHSDSRSYASDGAYAGSGTYGEGGATAGDSVHGEGWVDGYGRAHGGATAGSAVHYEHDGRRRSVWHGYNEDCPDRN